MRPDFRGFLAWVLSAHDARGWRQVALQTKSEKYCSQASRASMHCNRGRLRTLLSRFHTTKTHSGPELRAPFAMQQSLNAACENW
jgi:hypothetical protein